MVEIKKLIEVAMPIKEISVESVRDKSIRHGHISTLHLWWARRPLPISRAVVFGSLVFDPDDKNCPKQFKDAVKTLLNKKNIYKPYEKIPYGSKSIDEGIEDSLRNRLLMFIGKYSDKYIQNDKVGAGKKISDSSLIKWENRNNDQILNIARKLIWVSHDPENNSLELFDKYYNKIIKAEEDLYNTIDRDIETDEIIKKEERLKKAIKEFQNRMPKVFDPFAGGGAIPLEVSRLGCNSYANDINPVAHIIQKGSLEFPQKFGKRSIFSKDRFLEKYGEDGLKLIEKNRFLNLEEIEIENILAFDVEYYSQKLFNMAKEDLEKYYPVGKDGKKVIAYYWARVAKCSNRTCNAEVPLLKQFYLVNKKDRKIYIEPIIDGKDINFQIKEGIYDLKGWNYRGNLTCPICSQTTSVRKIKEQFRKKETKERMIAVIVEGDRKKEYRLPEDYELDILNSIGDMERFRPNEKMPIKYTQAMPVCSWGVDRWGNLFSKRQLLAIQTFIEKFNIIKKEILSKKTEYNRAILTYLGILIDKIIVLLTNNSRWDNTTEHGQSPFSRQAISMMFDYSEYTFDKIYNQQLSWIIRYINSESKNPFYTTLKNASSGDITQFENKFFDATVTDPPYYDAIAYGDLSDFFYVWLKRTLKDIYPKNFLYPQTPKSEECTALRHHHNNSVDEAEKHFQNKLQNIFKAVEYQTKGVVSIMFAHQSTKAWGTLMRSILNSGMNIMGSWAISTELNNRMVSLGNAALQSSVTVACKPVKKDDSVGDFNFIKKGIEKNVKDEIKKLNLLGFKGEDLLTACFGQAVKVFGSYSSVEKMSGDSITIEQLLNLTREIAFKSVISDIDTDDVTKFYIGWLTMYGFDLVDHDKVNKLIQIGFDIEFNFLRSNNIIETIENREVLKDYQFRNKKNSSLGKRKDSFMIDKIHKVLYIYNNRSELLKYIKSHQLDSGSSFWRVLISLFEILPDKEISYKLVESLINNKDSLIKDAFEKKDVAILREMFTE